MRVALRTIWSKDRIDALAKRLNDYREQLTLRVLLLLNANRKLQDGKLDTLLESSQEIVEVVTINLDTLHSRILGQLAGDSSRQARDRFDAERRHAETIAAILTTRDGHSRTITGPKYSTDTSKYLAEPGIVQTTTTYREHHRIHDGPHDEPPDFESKPATDTTKRILNALHFRQISDRRAAVSPAYQKTFDWIYRDPTSHNIKWDNLVEWLKHGRGCYWVSGKAGSGKSTLMKYLQDDPRTIHALREWTGSCKLVIGSFYFWYAGTSLQKSQAGLLRSLLLDVLSESPQLTVVLFPDLYRSVLAEEFMDRVEVSFIELSKAFQTLISSDSQGLKICFIVDGIDEYKGEHNDICEIFSQAETSTSVKILLSSRPIPACVHAFMNCPQLSLQKLTKRDIQNYVQDKLGQYALLVPMELTMKGVTRQIIDSIMFKASGVFLWVTLVVRLVIIGLQEYDTVPRLLQRIDDLPPDLEKLYDHMLGSMSPQNRVEGSRMLQLVLRSMLTHGDFPMTVLQLSFAEEEDCGIAIPKGISAISSQDESWRSESIEGRMRSRCCGLIEVLDPRVLGEDRSQKPVGFLHRTVVEFLQTDVIWRQVVSRTEGTGFNVDKALISSSLLEMKSKAPTTKEKEAPEPPPCFRSMLRMLTYEQNMDDGRFLMENFYRSEMTITMDHYWGDPAGSKSSGSLSRPPVKGPSRLSRTLTMRIPFPFLLSAACQCPTEYFDALLDLVLAPLVISNPMARHEFVAYLLICYLDEVQVPRRIALSRVIVASCLSPNQPISLPSENQPFWNHRWKHVLPKNGSYDWSHWEFLLYYATDLTQCSDPEFSNFLHLGIPESLCDIIISMIEKEANLRFMVLTWTESRSGRRARTYAETQEATPFAVLQQLMLRTWNRRTSRAYQNTKDVVEANEALTEKMCSLEDRMRFRTALLWTTAHPRDHHAIPSTRKSANRSKDSQSRHGNRISFTKLMGTSKAGKSRSTTEVTEPNVPQNEQTKALILADSPWRNYQAPVLDTLTSRPRLRKASDDPKPSRNDHWDVTPRARRVELLNPEEQELTVQLARMDLTARDQRLIQSKMLQLTPQVQSQIFECSQNLRLTKQDVADCV